MKGKSNKMTIYVMGHTNPDSDAIVSALAVAELLRQRGLDVVACRQGDVNPESKFILEKFGGIKTASPLEFYGQPVGASSTIITNIFKSEGKTIPASVAGAMMCAILSDTVLFKSPTTTDWDRQAVAELAKIAGVEKPLDLGLEMLKVKSSIENDTAEMLINRDFKEFNINGKKLGVGQIELIDGSMAESKKPAILDKMKKMLADGGYHSILLLITDIMKEGSEMLAVSQNLSDIERVFDVKFDANNTAWIDGMMSRKKQVVPPLEQKL